MSRRDGTVLRLIVLAFAAVAGCGVATTTPPDRLAASPPLGLPAVPVPRDNPVTAEKVALGQKLFMDRRLSHNGTISCAMCHIPEQGFTSYEMATAVGIEGRSHRRNAPSLLNVAYAERLFHDGRESTLENQAWGPLLTANEMANPSIGYVVDTIRGLPDYSGLFEKAFEGRGPSMVTVAQAIASFQRTLVSGDSRFDRWYYGKQANALDADEQAGFRLFSGKAGCAACHHVAAEWALFTDHRFHNTGVGWAASMGGRRTHRVRLSEGVFTEIEDRVIDGFGEPRQNDVGRFEVTEVPADSWAYRTPTLRDVAVTMPYMHDGSLATLEEVVDFYDRGGFPNPNQDPLVRPLGLTGAEKTQLVAFLRTLTGSGPLRPPLSPPPRGTVPREKS